jgi:hypothetical protein
LDIYYATHYLSHFINSLSSYTTRQPSKLPQGHHQPHHQLQHFNAQDHTTLLPAISCNANHSPSNQDYQKWISVLKVHLAGSVTVWVIKTQKTITLSTTESELNAISQAVCQALYMMKLFAPPQVPVDLPVPIINDNHSTLVSIHNHKSTCSEETL